MIRTVWVRGLVVAGISFLCCSCSCLTRRQNLVLERSTVGSAGLGDTGPEETLRRALEESAVWLGGQDPALLLPFGERRIRAGTLLESITIFRKLVDAYGLSARLREEVAGRFDLYRSSALITGYYEPALEGCLERTERCLYPLYRPPADPALRSAERGRIDAGGALAGQGLEVVWLTDPLDRFFLHVQGSGVVRTPDGETIRVGYDGDNGRPYVAIGKTLKERYPDSFKTVTMQSIREFLDRNREMIPEILASNPRYIYFKISRASGALGALGRQVTPLRTVAADLDIYPKGAAGFLRWGGETSREGFSGFVAVQDAGSAIRGPHRFDLFCGTGDSAGEMAGRLQSRGDLYLLLLKGASLE